MKIFHTLVVSLIIVNSIAATLITSANQCICKQIQYQQDCLSVYIPSSNSTLGTTCRWILNANASGKQAKGVCLQGITASSSPTSTPFTALTVVTSNYCSSIVIINCASTLGCATTDGKTCTAFTGCSSYTYNTNSACQSVSTFCTTDGTQCVNKQPCSYYTSQISKCGLFSSSSGSGTCKVSGTSCVDQTCADAPTSLVTDAACNSFLGGCVSSGAGCVTAHITCNSQTGNATSCPTFIGLVPSEGQCKYSGTGNQCAARTCADAPTSLNTNQKCIAYLPSCLYTIGQGCASSTQSCSQMNFALGCIAFVNTSGVPCSNDTSSTPPVKCRERVCADNTTATTNSDCNANGLTGCVTNGAGCVPAGSNICTSYSGTNAQCALLIGANGPCKGTAPNSNISQACTNKICSDAPSTVKTNQDCAAIQVGCVTTGYGCLQNLPVCSSYFPAALTPCDGYQGSDGPCTLLPGLTNCSVRTCAGASTTTVPGINTTTNQGCQAWVPYISASIPGCVTNGTICIVAGSCSALSQISCIGYNNCQFIQSCVQNNLCSAYMTQSQCISNFGQFGRSCTWNGTCAPTACPASSASITTDAACQRSGLTATPGCYYQGTGTTCVDATQPISCSSFTGDNTFFPDRGCAVLFNGQCASANPAFAAVAACVARTCSNFYQIVAGPTSNAQCSIWLSGCLSNGYQGCLSQFAGCPQYFGTQVTCNAIFANGVQCYNTSNATISTSCMVKTPDLILQISVNQIWTDAQCSAALANAVSSQIAIATVGTTGVCVSNTSPCFWFAGNLSQCLSIQNLKSGRCTKTTGFCYPKAVPNCQVLAGTSISSCQAQYYACTWAYGTFCTQLGQCSTYFGTPVNCNALTDNNGLKCGSNQGFFGTCISANFCTDYNTGNYNTAISYCQTLTDALGNTCTAYTNADQVCNYPITGNKYVIGYKQCSPGQIIINGKCTTPMIFSCTDLVGFYFTAQSNPNNCASVSPNCTWNTAGTCCIANRACTGYFFAAAPATALIGNAYCNQYKSNYAIPSICQYIGVVGGTQYYTTCADPPASCTAITTDTAGTTLTAAICAQFQNDAGKYCGFNSGTTCAEPIACSVITSVAGLAGATTCQGAIDSTTYTPCSQPTGAQTLCQTGVATCAGYSITFGITYAESASLCQGYFTAAGVKCGFIIGATTCSNRTCGDAGIIQSSVGCSGYLVGCVWTALNTCVANSTINSCTQLAAGYSIAVCNLLFDNKGRQCNWVTGVTCSDQQCSQYAALGANATHAQCQLLNFACTAATPVSSKKCQTIQTSCFKYIVNAADIADCAQLVDSAGIPCSPPPFAPTISGPCTYGISQPTFGITRQNCNNPGWTYDPSGPTCTGTSTIVATCSGATAIGSSFAAQLAYCQTLTHAIYGKPCFFTQFTLFGALQTNCVDSVLPGLQNQLVYAPNCSAANVSNTPIGGYPSPGTGSDADCAAFSSGCTATITSALVGTAATPCAQLTCAMASTIVATSTEACKQFQAGCIWNGTNACISERDSTCLNIYGTVTSCTTFAVNRFPCYQPNLTAITSATAQACAQITCFNAPPTITNDAGCERWFPSTYSSLYNSVINPGPNLICVWTGTTGCTFPQSCSAFIGNATTCLTYTAMDGPCKSGTGVNCTPLLCTDAPNSYTTDAQCAKFANSAQQCLTTGYGCVARSMLSCNSIVNQQSCISSSLGGVGTNQCSWLSQCVASVITCTDSSLLNATLCTTTPITGATCVWNPYTNLCQNMTCAFLPSTLTTHQACSTKLSTCTTTGAGCITLGPCASYTAAGQQVCLSANNSEAIGQPQISKCTWANNACRVIACIDNTIASTNSACNVKGLTQCVTTGQGCLQMGAFICGQLLKSSACLSDGQGNPCLWLNGQCLSFTGCTSIAWTTYAQCSQIGCTTNGITCIALDSCSNYTTAPSCLVQNNYQICGWLPVGSNNNKDPVCKIFGVCTDALGATNAICQIYNSSCISNGINCQTQQTCSTYTQYACLNSLGTDGQCFWYTTNSTSQCRTQQCSDYIGQNPTDAICASFPAPVINTCTTNGTTCVKRSTCSSYTKDGCVIGTDGTCFWVTTGSGSCRVKICTDAQFTSNAFCGNLAITFFTTTNTITKTSYLQCVSNGTVCIPKSNCSYYTTKIACQGGGLDGSCAFTPNSYTGTCALMTSCSSANSDQLACLKAYDRCFYQNQTCSPLTCDQAASFSSCKPIPSFDYSSYQVCGPVSSTNSTCVPQEASQLTASTCFNSTLSSYTWNDTSSSCNYCGTINQSTTVNNTTENVTQTSKAIFITGFIFYGMFLTGL